MYLEIIHIMLCYIHVASFLVCLQYRKAGRGLGTRLMYMYVCQSNLQVAHEPIEN